MAKSRTIGSKASKDWEKQLERYRSMRDFAVTSEPRGGGSRKTSAPSAGSLPFVIQKHAATRLHYDFRLAWNGVLKSWAVTKGPSQYPGDKRLAVQVEDHPIEYGSFEGTIPKGQYGGGAVMVWDYGNWVPHSDVDRGLAEGHLKFDLNGTKLKGSWALVRMHSRDAKPGKPNWLLIKEKDEFANDEESPVVTETQPDSAVTKRSIEQIAKDNDRTWQSNRAPNDQPEAVSKPDAVKKLSRPKNARLRSLKSVPAEKFPGFVSPQLATQTAAPPTGNDWVHELKLDGYRIQIQLRRKEKTSNANVHATLLTRKGLDWTRRMPQIARAAEQLKVESAILDGETVVLDEKGTTSFADLQAAFQDDANAHMTYFAFDLLHLNGHNLRYLPLRERKKILAQVLAPLENDSVLRLSEHFEGSGPEIFSKACALGAEGIVSKLASAPYLSDRGSAWLKSKCFQEQEFVVGGFTGPSNGSDGIGALLVGYFDGGKLRYAGRSGTGFTQKTQGALRKQLNELEQSKPPFGDLPKGVSKGVHWVKPTLVAQISFANWTRDNLLRQAAFKGLREDKPAKEVVRESAVPQKHSQRDAAAKSAQPRTAQGATDLPITHPEKLLDKESGMTKQMLAEYYLEVAERMLPHVGDRPLSILRCPEGTGKQCFFQKHIGLGLPKGVQSIPVLNRKTGETEDYLTLSTSDGLVGMAQMGVLEIHPWGSRNESMEKPDRIIFDLDPDEAVDWKTLAITAKLFRAVFEEIGLESYLKTTGGKGLHIVAPIRAENEWQVVKKFAHEVVLRIEKEQPDLYVTKMTKALRKNRIYLDYLRNDRGSTAVAPYSPRARSGVPVALPLEWRELNSKTRPVFHVTDFAKWRKRLNSDPWATMTTNKQRLTAQAIKKMSG